MSFNFAPRGWVLCNGQILSINQNQALFALLGTTYGGNGIQNFALPNLQGRVLIHFGAGRTLGEMAGKQTHTLQTSEMPSHTHDFSATNQTATQSSPAGNYLATTGSSVGAVYSGNPPNLNTALNPAAISIQTGGGGQPHNNMQPYTVINFSIALQGIFPSQN